MNIKLGYDDSLDCFGIHGVGSDLGVILLSFFIRDSWMVSAAAGSGNGSWTMLDQLMFQLQGIGATIAIAAVGISGIYFIVEKTIGLRLDPEREIIGMDQSLHGEHGYGLINSDIM